MSTNATTSNARDSRRSLGQTLFKCSLKFASYNCRTMLHNSAGELISRTLNQRDIDIACLSEVRLPDNGSKCISPARSLHTDFEQFLKNRPQLQWPCPKCYRNAKKNAIRCTSCSEWWHLPCAGVRYSEARKASGWKCEYCQFTEAQDGNNGSYKMYWSGPTDGSGLHGVAVLVRSQLADSVVSWEAKSPRLMMLRIATKPMNVVVISAYAPIEDACAMEKDSFYDQLELLMKSVKSSDFLLLGGDFNARIGPRCSAERLSAGPFGLGVRNDNGNRMMTFMQTSKLFAANTNFRHKRRHLATWRSPDGKTFNQIDYVLVKSRWRTSVQDARSYWGSHWNSDHALVCTRIKLRLAANKRKPQTCRYNVDRLAIEEERQKVVNAVTTKLQEEIDENDIAQRWNRLKGALVDGAQSILGTTRHSSKPWIMKETLDLIEQHKAGSRPRAVQTEIKRLLKKDLDEHWNRLAADMEHASAIGDSRRLFQLLKLGKRSAGISENIKGKNGEPLQDLDSKLGRWADHFKELLNRPLPANPLSANDLQQKQDLAIPTAPPTLAEVVKAIKKLKNGKAPGEDQIPPECWKACEHDAVAELVEILRLCWEQEQMPPGWDTAVVIPLFKKGDRTLCSNHRGISLLDLAMKVLEMVIVDRIKPHREASTRESQAGFRSGRGCADQIFCLRQIIERRYEFRRPFVACFVDFSAAFDSVHRDSMWKIVRAEGVPPKIVSMLKVLYKQTLCTVRVYNNLTESFEVTTGVRQGAIGSPILFNFVIDWILNSALSANDGVDIGDGSRVTDLTFADDIALLAEDEALLQHMINRLQNAASRVGMIISPEKTKSMSCAGGQALNVLLNGHVLEHVGSFKYLGSEIDASGQATLDVNARVSKAAAAMNALNSLWRKRNVSISTKRRVYLAGVRPVLLYGCESWPVLKQLEKKLEVFEHRSWRRILRISYLDRVTNMDVRRQFGIEETVAAYVKRRRLTWFGHVARMNPGRLPSRILFCDVSDQWARKAGGVRKTWIRRLKEDLDIPRVTRSFRGNATRWKKEWLLHVKQLAADRSAFNSIIHDVVNR